jgi:N-acetylmuramoyl-L-alanine amidase
VGEFIAEKGKAVRIENHLLVDDPRIQPYIPAPRGWIPSITIKPEMLLEHYTATTSLVDAFASRYFAHLYIDENGLIYQRVPLNKYACHAGVSVWGGRNDLNAYSHGIEHVNFGFVYKNWKGQYYRDGKFVDPAWVMDAPHRLQASLRYWVRYPEKQLISSWDVTKCLDDHYHYVDVVGHEDVTAKVDPGPAYPLVGIKDAIYGYEINSLFMVSRSWGGSQVGLGGVSLKWLPNDYSPSKIWCNAGTVVKKLEWFGRWVKVIRTGDSKFGWIKECYLRRILGE